MAHWARPGIKCVCTREPRRHESINLWRWLLAKYRGALPMRGSVYTVDRVELHEPTGLIVLFLVGLPFAHSARCFSPLISKTQSDDVALFTHLLNTAPAREHEGAL